MKHFKMYIQWIQSCGLYNNNVSMQNFHVNIYVHIAYNDIMYHAGRCGSRSRSQTTLGRISCKFTDSHRVPFSESVRIPVRPILKNFWRFT